MSAPITFLGTCAADYFGTHSCDEDNCNRAKELGGKNIRNASSLFVPPDIQIDFSKQGETELSDWGIESGLINHLLITHGHYDHFCPISIMDLALKLDHPLTVYGNSTIADTLEFASKYRWTDDGAIPLKHDGYENINMNILTPGESFGVGDITVTPVLANHMITRWAQLQEQQALNYVLENNGKTLFYGLDSGDALPGSFDILTGFTFDVAVFEGTFGYRDQNKAEAGHHDFNMLKETVRRFRDAEIINDGTKIIISHISQHYVPPHDDIVDDLEKEGMIAAYDGMAVNW